MKDNNHNLSILKKSGDKLLKELNYPLYRDIGYISKFTDFKTLKKSKINSLYQNKPIDWYIKADNIVLKK